MPIKLIGRTTNFSGKTLWEILGNLKNFGVGRIVARSVFERYDKPCFIKIVKVETLPNEENRKVRVWVEKTFRGYKYPKLVEMCSTTYKADYKLIPKHLEDEYCNRNMNLEEAEKILPSTVTLPPLLNYIVKQEMRAAGENVPETDVEIPIKIRQGRYNRARTAKEGETPNVSFTMSIAQSKHPELYKGLDNIRIS